MRLHWQASSLCLNPPTKALTCALRASHAAAAAAAALQARQAFGLGSDVFVASNLDAHEAINTISHMSVRMLLLLLLLRRRVRRLASGPMCLWPVTLMHMRQPSKSLATLLHP
jgi:hypothetical protein